MVKQESQRRLRSATSPVRSFSSSTEVQKQVGQTIVQLPQVRQRSATSSQRGCSRLASSSSRTSSERMCRPMLPAASRHHGVGRALGRASPRPRGAAWSRAVAAPRSLPTSTRNSCSSPSSSVSARSKPAFAFGPVSIETQKQVPPAWPQFTATMNAPCAPRLVVRIDVGPLQEDAVLDGDRMQLAGAHGDERITSPPAPRSR